MHVIQDPSCFLIHSLQVKLGIKVCIIFGQALLSAQTHVQLQILGMNKLMLRYAARSA